MPCFQVMALSKSAHKFLFSKGQVGSLNVKRFHIITHSNVASMKIAFMKLTTFFISNTRDIYTKLS